MRYFIKLIRDDRGATAIEYALIASLISIAAIGAFANLGGGVNNKFVSVNQALTI
jgi:pilus assembly protein Flp/PilA